MSSIDVVVPNYNYGRYLRSCVESVLDQEDVTVRVLIIDNASTDDSADIARALASEDDRVQIILRPRNIGPHASFNEGIDWAEADCFLMLCADDVLVPRALRRALTVMEMNPSISFCHGRDLAIRDRMPVPRIARQPDMPPHRLISGRAFIKRFCRMGVFRISSPTVIVRTSAQKQAGHYREALPHTDDYEMWLRLAMYGPVAELDCIQAGIRSHDANRSKEIAADQMQHIVHTAAAVESFFAHEGSGLRGSRSMRRLALQGIANRAYWCGIANLLQRNRKARDFFRLAFRISPISVVLPPIDYLLSRPDRWGRLYRVFLAGPKKQNRRLS
ncbi:glycosyltransferase family 2 protein [Rhizobium sp. NFR03]|uniref:glycosyltransferase family 2 protein n=1 Tax=Rhizobium sp. NFR03 TaxID=1566263 RepID=UPI0008C935F7|nr:glycosyltransferase family 2 protein [Rhizobium sp. NFR03]SES42074.1 Glycosyl transferase family 2 [Rhizobium sp. NFR03]